MTDDFIASGWFGVSTSRESGSVRSSVAIGRLLTIASTSIKRVLKHSSFNWFERICLFPTTSMWLECGAFIFHENQSQISFSGVPIFSWFISRRATPNSFVAPSKLVSWSGIPGRCARTCRPSTGSKEAKRVAEEIFETWEREHSDTFKR